MGSFLMLAIVGALMGVGIVSGVMDQVEGQVRDVVNEELDNFEEEFDSRYGLGGVNDVLEASEPPEEAVDDTVDASALDDDGQSVIDEVSDGGGFLFGVPQEASAQGEEAEDVSVALPDGEVETAEDMAVEPTPVESEDEQLASVEAAPVADDEEVSAADVLEELFGGEVLDVPTVEAAADERGAPQLVIENVDADQEVLVVEAEWVLPESAEDGTEEPVDVRVEPAESWLDVVLTDQNGQEAVVRAETPEPEELQVVVLQNDREIARV